VTHRLKEHSMDAPANVSIEILSFYLPGQEAAKGPASPTTAGDVV